MHTGKPAAFRIVALLSNLNDLLQYKSSRAVWLNERQVRNNTKENKNSSGIGILAFVLGDTCRHSNRPRTVLIADLFKLMLKRFVCEFLERI